jgi:hypothetical protein
VFSSFWLKTKWTLCPTLLFAQSPSLWPFYQQMKQDLKQRCFADVAEVQWESLAALDRSPLKILDNVYRIGSSTNCCFQSQGEYFVGGSCMNILNKFL